MNNAPALKNVSPYLELLGTLYLLIKKIRLEGLLSIDQDIENPKESPTFNAISPYTNNEIAYTFICDVLRLMINGNFNHDDTQRYMEAYIKSSSLTDEQASLFECVKLTIIANLNGNAPLTALEHGRQGILSHSKPTFHELEKFLRQLVNEYEPSKEMIDSRLQHFYASLS